MGKSILIVEDNIDNFHLVARVVRQQGYEVFHARTADEGYQIVQEHALCLILLDLRLPGVDGWTFARTLKNNPAFSHIPIVAISVQVEADDVERALAAGCEAYLEKPFGVRQLREAVEQYAIC